MNHLPPEVFDLYLDDRLDPAERAAVEAHLAACSDCQRELNALRALAARLDALPIEPMPVDLTTLVLRRIAPAPRPWLHRAGAALLIAEAIAVAALAFWFGALSTLSITAIGEPSTLDPSNLLVTWLGLLAVDPLPMLDDLLGAAPVASLLPTTSDSAPLLVVAAAIWLLGNRLLLIGPTRASGRERGVS